MKLAICGFGFSGATLPLAKALAHSDSIIKKVDCYYLVYKSKKCSEIESVDYGNELLKIGIPHKLDMSNKIYNYLPDNVSIYLFPLCPNGPVGMHWFSKILNYLLIIYLSFYIILKKYKAVNIIAHTSLEFTLYNIVSKFIKTIISVHEVYVSLNNEKEIKPKLKSLSQKEVDIVFHSKSVRDEFMHSINYMRCKLHVIPFSNFDSYSSFLGNTDVVNITNYILFIGSIQPYKGLGLLKEALDHHSMDSVNVVIAGKGNVPELDYFKNRKNTCVLNRYVSNEELVSLIKNCAFIVCPYLMASQTGIAPTAFVFNKPIVATNVGAFHEVIKDDYNGFLVNPNDPVLLRDRILKLYIDVPFREKLMENILKSHVNVWDNIAIDYLKILLK